MTKAVQKSVPLSGRQKVQRFFTAKKRALLRSARSTSTESSTSLPQNPTVILKILLNGTFIVVSLLLVLLLISFARGNTYVLWRIEAFVVILFYLILIRYFIYRDRTKVAAALLIGFYTAIATIMLTLWSINDTIGILILGFVIVLAAVTLGSRAILFAAFGVVVLMLVLQSMVVLGLIHPDISSLKLPASYGDVMGYAAIFIIISIVSWLSRRQIEHAFHQARAAEVALEHEKEQLEVRLEERTRKLQEAQLQEMQQLYRFAELGQLSTLLLHDLANHLNVLTLDIEDIQQRHSRSKAITHAQESIGYLEAMVAQTRLQLQDRDEPVRFTVFQTLQKTIDELTPRAENVNVEIEFEHTHESDELQITGDPLRLSQIVSIVVTNAIEASAMPRSIAQAAKVTLSLESHGDVIEIRVRDQGAGITQEDRRKLFEPLQSKKENGMGIGLFIAKQTIEMHFKGTIAIDTESKDTVFVISLPYERPR